MEGISKIKAAVETLRKSTPKSIGNYKVLAVTDLISGIRHDMVTLEDEPDDFPAADVLIFELEGAKMILRPSGTEPKLKAYCFTKGSDASQADTRLKQLVDTTFELMTALTR